MATHADRILGFIRSFPGRDDDEVARTLDIQPRQTVNIACRRLQSQGLIDRRRGPNGKICNYPLRSAASETRTLPPMPAPIQAPVLRPVLTPDTLLKAGFVLSAKWTLDVDRNISPSASLPKQRGVYAFVLDGRAYYVGLATMGIAKRLYFYGRPGATQRTSQRLNVLITETLEAGKEVSIYVAHPPDLSWNGLPVSGDAGLELGLIETYDLPWNMRGVR